MRNWLPVLIVLAVLVFLVAWEIRYSLQSPNHPGQFWTPWAHLDGPNPASGRSNPSNGAVPVPDSRGS